MSDHLNPTAVFLLQLVVILGLVRVLGLLAQRVHQPRVIAEIAVGILLGPSVLGALAPDVLDALFPPSALPVLRALSELGLVLFMFLVGLEIDVKQARRQLGNAVVVGLASLAVPFVAATALSPWLYRELSSPEVPFLDFALFLGVALSITAFPALARILAERRLVGTKIGAIAVSAAATADVSAWCVLATIVAFARAGTSGSVAFTALLTVAVCAVGILIGRPLVSRISARWAHPSGLTDNMVATVLLALFAVSLATEGLGLHALFGAFLFGAVFPRRGGEARALAERVEDLTGAVLLPIFFVFSGLSTQIGLLDEPRDWLIGGAVLLVAIVGKVGGTMVAALRSDLSWREMGALATLMNMRGPMQLVVLHVGLDMEVLSPTLFTILVLTGLATTAMAPPILRVLLPSNMAVRLDGEHEPAGPSTQSSALVCVSEPESGPSLALLSHALTSRIRGAVYAMHLVPASGRPSSRLPARSSSDDAERVLEPLLSRASALGLTPKSLSFVSGSIGADICATAAVKDAQWVLLGGTDEASALEREPIRHVLRHAAPAVAVLVGRRLARLGRVYVAADAPKTSIAADVAGALAGETANTELVRLDRRDANRPSSPTDELLVVDLVEDRIAEGQRQLAADAITRGVPVLFVRPPLPPRAATVVARTAGTERVAG